MVVLPPVAALYSFQATFSIFCSLFKGLLFSCGAISCFFVWVGWIAAYILFKEDMVLKDISVCCGLIATPTVLILVVFIPKVKHIFLINNVFRDAF